METNEAPMRPAGPRERLIVALDFPTREEAFRLVDDLGDAVTWYKIGMELFYAEGPKVVQDLRARGKRVFLDLKLHDIPNTMAGAVRSIGRLGVGLLTVHAPAGAEALAACASAAREVGQGADRPQLIGVTRLTSLAAPNPDRPWDDVVALAGTAVEAGLDGWVAPVQAASPLRAAHGSSPILVCPGIRLPDGDVGDQVSVGTPEGAVSGGADWIVVGRPITRADEPKAQAERIVTRMLHGCGDGAP